MDRAIDFELPDQEGNSWRLANQLTHGAVLLVGAIEVSAGRATPGAVVAALIIVGILLPQLRDLGRVQAYWHGATLSLRKIGEFLAIPSPFMTDQPTAPPLIPGPGRLEFRHVSIPDALQDISAIAAPRSVVAIVGPNGSGKSTLLALAARLLDPVAGTVELDGQVLAAHSLASVRRAIGIVGPDLPLLRGTIAKNLHYRWPGAPESEIRRVLALCELDEFLKSLPLGAQTRIAEGGFGISVGQRQRIALARALVGDPQLLLLDEADATLDYRATQVIDRLLARHRGTALIVTHRRERVFSADAVWYLEDGRLLEAGPPQTVMAADGPTARLFATAHPAEVA